MKKTLHALTIINLFNVRDEIKILISFFGKHHLCKDQSINQSINQLDHQSINQSLNKSIN